MDDDITDDIDVLRTWRGRSESITETISSSWCRKLEQTLDRDPTLNDGDPLPPLWHFITHLASARLSELGPDGHPRRGGFLPPVALPRRMWAGGRFIFHGDVPVGGIVSKTSTIEDVAMKTGRTGLLCFVTVRHELTVDGQLRITEEQDLVYRDALRPGASAPAPEPAPSQAPWSRTVVPSEVMLFRYSALTFNSHRIHYDRPYARDVEGYPDLVVHGPLTATLLADLAESERGRRLATFSFRALAPLFAGDPFTIAGEPADDAAELWAVTPDGGLAMRAHATYRDEPTD